MNGVLRKSGAWLREHSGLLKGLFLISILLFVINQMMSILQGMTWLELKAVLMAQGRLSLVVMIVLGMVAVLPMLLYDWVTVEVLEEHGKPPMARGQLFVAAWTTNTINNLAGFGGVIGATLRARFYGSETDTKKVVTTVSKVAIFMLSGLSLLCLITFSDIYFIRPTTLYRDYALWLFGGSLYLPALVAFTRLKRQTLFADFPLKRVAKLILGSFGQWVGALSVFLVIGQLLDVPVKPLTVYPLFVAATLIGMISMVPGGMGTFDVLMIIGLSQGGVSRELAVAWLLYYRLFYYLLPFLTGLLSYLYQASTKVNHFFDGLPKLLGQKLSHFILVCMVYFSGVTMVLLSTVPNLSNISWLFRKLLPFSFDFLDQLLNMLVGLLLLGLARGVANRVKRAYLPTLGILSFCIINTISRTISWQLIVFYLFLLLCLFWSRKEFYRKQLIFSWEALVVDGVLYTVLLVLYSVVGYYATDKINHGELPTSFLLFPSEAIWLQGFLGLVLAVITIFFLYYYLGQKEKPGSYFNQAEVGHFLSVYQGTSYSHLNYLKDKRYYFYQVNGKNQVMFSFEQQSNKLMILGDPVGEPSLIEAASLSFMTYADELGYQLVFYGVTTSYVLLLHDLGFEMVKLGEEGTLVYQEQARLGSPLSAKIKNDVLHLTAQGYRFDVYTGPLPTELLNQLEKISDQWVSRYGERYFSVGRFKREYLNQGAIGLVYNQQDLLQGFISFTSPSQEKVVAYDLIRYQTEAPEEILTFILSQAREYWQEQGMKEFKLGLAPLSRVGEAGTSFINERGLSTFYRYSYHMTDFRAQRALKAEFVTNWQPCYLAYQKGNNFLVIVGQLYLLIERGQRKQPRPVQVMLLE